MVDYLVQYVGIRPNMIPVGDLVLLESFLQMYI